MEIPKALWGTVLRRIRYSEGGIVKLPGPILRWDTIHEFLRHKMQHKKPWRARAYQLKDQVPTSDESPAAVDKVVCAKCGTVYYVPDISLYPGGYNCYQCLPVVMTMWGPMTYGANKKLVKIGSNPGQSTKSPNKSEYDKLIARIDRMLTVANPQDATRLMQLRRQYEEKRDATNR